MFNGNEFMGDSRIEAHSLKMNLINILDRYDLEISSIKGKRMGLDNKKKHMKNDIYGHIGLVIVLFMIFMWILYHIMAGAFIFSPQPLQLIKFFCSLIIEVFLAIVIAKYFRDMVAKILEYHIFIESGPFRKYIYSHNITSYHRQYDYYTKAIVELENRRRPFQKMKKKTDDWEDLTPEEISKIESFSEADYRYKLQPFYDYKIRLSEFFKYLTAKK